MTAVLEKFPAEKEPEESGFYIVHYSDGHFQRSYFEKRMIESRWDVLESRAKRIIAWSRIPEWKAVN